MFQLRMIFAPGLKVLPGHVRKYYLAATASRKVETTFRQEGFELGSPHFDARLDNPTRDDFCDAAVASHHDVIVSM